MIKAVQSFKANNSKANSTNSDAKSNIMGNIDNAKSVDSSFEKLNQIAFKGNLAKVSKSLIGDSGSKLDGKVRRFAKEAIEVISDLARKIKGENDLPFVEKPLILKSEKPPAKGGVYSQPIIDRINIYNGKHPNDKVKLPDPKNPTAVGNAEHELEAKEAKSLEKQEHTDHETSFKGNVDKDDESSKAEEIEKTLGNGISLDASKICQQIKNGVSIFHQDEGGLADRTLEKIQKDLGKTVDSISSSNIKLREATGSIESSQQIINKEPLSNANSGQISEDSSRKSDIPERPDYEEVVSQDGLDVPETQAIDDFSPSYNGQTILENNNLPESSIFTQNRNEDLLEAYLRRNTQPTSCEKSSEVITENSSRAEDLDIHNTSVNEQRGEDIDDASLY